MTASDAQCGAYSRTYPQSRCCREPLHRGAHQSIDGEEFFCSIGGEWRMFEAVRPPSAMTDLSALPLPTGLEEHLSRTSRERSVHDHSVSIDPQWWRAVLVEAEMPGDPPRGLRQAGHDQELLSRRRLFELGREIDEHSSHDVVLGFLWHVLAWGAYGRTNRRRVSSVAADIPGSVAALRKACLASRESPVGGYVTLRPRGASAIPWLGPAFLTKVLYFAGGGLPEHPSLILDDRVAGALHHYGWVSLRTGGNWPAPTYERYCRLMWRWSEDASTRVGRAVAVDELERWLFRQGRPLTSRAVGAT